MPDKFDLMEARAALLDPDAGVTTITERLLALESAETADVDLETLRAIRIEALQRLDNLTRDDIETALPLILGLLLPRCLEGTRGRLKEATYNAVVYRERLVDWVDGFAGPDRSRLRDRVLDELLAALQGGSRDGASLTIAQIGFRRPDVAHALWDLVDTDTEEGGDIALFALSRLGITNQGRARVLDAANARAATGRFNLLLINVYRILSEPSSIGMIRERWLTPEVGDEQERISLSLGILADIADAHADDSATQERVWSAIVEVIGRSPELAFREVYLSTLSSKVNHPMVVPTLLRFLQDESGESEGAVYRRYLLQLRAAEAVRPMQLAGWRSTDLESVKGVLLADATRDTRAQGRFQTMPMRVKESAWGTLLCLAETRALDGDVVDEAVAQETNGLVSQEVSKSLACVRLPQMPESLINWATADFDGERDDPGMAWAGRMGAIRLARSAASRAAFDALRRSGFTFGGRILQQSVDALAEVSVTLAREGDRDIGDILADSLSTHEHPRIRTLAIGALEVMAREGILSLTEFRRIAATLHDETIPNLERGFAMSALGFAPDNALDESTMELLRTQADSDSDDLKWRALEALARLGALERDEMRLGRHLGLERGKGGWQATMSESYPRWAAFVLGILYRRQPKTFAGPLAQIIRVADWPIAVQALGQVEREHESRGGPVPEEIARATIARIHDRQTTEAAELDLLEIAGRLFARELVRESWDSVWDRWLPDAREALARSLGVAPHRDTVSHGRANALLFALCGDGMYAVRHAAYRSLARHWIEPLAKTCRIWAQSEDIRTRERAAEACAWLMEGDPSPVEIVRQLREDIEPSVRDIANESLRSQRERQWASDYTRRLVAIAERPDNSSLPMWCYGRALGTVGNEETIDNLQEITSSKHLAPHLRYWYECTIDVTTKRWREVTGHWPESWVSQRGVIEEVDGAIDADDRSEGTPMHFTLWGLPPRTLAERFAWEASARPLI